MLIGCESATVIDESLYTNALAMDGATATVAQAKFGTHSADCPSGGQGFFSASAVPSLIGLAGPWTAECFVKFGGRSDIDQLMGQYPTGTGAVPLWRVVVQTSGVIKLQLTDNTNTQYELASSAQSIGTSVFYHVAVDFDGTAYRVYWNGTQVGKLVAAYVLPSDHSVFSCGGRYDVDNNNIFGVAGDEIFLDELRITAGVARYATDTSFTVPVAAFARPGPLETLVREGFGLAESAGLHLAQYAVLADTVTLEQAAALLRRVLVVSADTIALTPAIAALRGVVLTERLALHPALTPTQHTRASLADAVTLALQQALGTPATVSDTVAVTLTQTIQRGLQLLETLRLSELVVGAAHYHKTFADTVALASALANFFGLAVADTIGIAQATALLHTTYAQLADGLGLAPSLTPRLLLNVTMAETAGITAEQAVTALYRGDVLHDGIEISAGYLEPSGSFTTWVMNCRTRAVTEYDNFVFNSFARNGDVYLGASDTGLYELLGDDDASVAITSRIRSGFMQFGGTTLSRIKAAYLAARGDGEFVLKIITGDDETVSYGVSTRSGRSTKVHMGKGLRARYFAFELIGDGADFDLDTLEFVPIVLQRRV